MKLLDTREIYRPFKYPIFEEIHQKLYTSFWHPNEVTLDEDVTDFRFKLTDAEREIVTRILRNFVQSEIHVGCYWGDFVASWFKHPEIQNVARYISGSESIHANGYDLLNATLGLNDYDKLKEDKKLYARVAALTQKKAKKPDDILRQIFLYSVCGEGVSLFSSFITLFAFTRQNKLRGMGQIISWSALDEQLHADVGVHLFNTLKKEYDLFDDEMKTSLYEIIEEIVEIEMNLIDRVFENNETTIIKPEVVKNFVKDKANKQLKKVGLKKTFKVDKEMLKESDFFDIMVNGESVVDFFANKETAYSKGLVIFNSKVWDR